MGNTREPLEPGFNLVELMVVWEPFGLGEVNLSDRCSLRSSWAVLQLMYRFMRTQDMAEANVMNKHMMEGGRCRCRPILFVC